MRLNNFLGSLGADPPAWAKSSAGETNVYPSLSGMVGTPNSRGNWVCWKPRVGIRYDAEYMGRRITVENRGDGSYTLIDNGTTSRRDYDPRWETGVYFDAAGNPVATPEAANVAGPVQQPYFNSGLVMQESSAQAVTRSSDGRRDVWASDSGMAGMVNARNAWVLWVPAPGIVIESNYGGKSLAIMNNGDGTYALTVAGTTSRRAYSVNWQAGKLYDARGVVVSDPQVPNIEMDPVSAFFAPGAVASSTQTGPSAPVSPGGTALSPGGTPFTNVATGSGAPSGVATGGGSFTSLSPIFPAPSDASWVTGTFPDETTSGVQPAPASGIDGKTVLALAALAFTVLN